jgi:predicted secreted protein
MGWFTGTVLFVLIWWTALFAVLPFLARPNAEPDPVSGVRGTQSKPFVLRAVILTTVVSAALFMAFLGLIDTNMLSFRHGWFAVHGNCAIDVRFCS